MPKTPDQHLAEVAEVTFESLAFLIQMPEEFSDGTSEPVVAATVTFAGPFAGTLMITASEGMLDELATNMLGMDGEPPTDEQQTDAFKELLNVVCGNLLPVIAGTEAVFRVDSPTLADTCDIPDEFAGHPLWARSSLLLDAGRAELALYVQAGALQAADSAA